MKINTYVCAETQEIFTGTQAEHRRAYGIKHKMGYTRPKGATDEYGNHWFEEGSEIYDFGPKEVVEEDWESFRDTSSYIRYFVLRMLFGHTRSDAMYYISGYFIRNYGFIPPVLSNSIECKRLCDIYLLHSGFAKAYRARFEDDPVDAPSREECEATTIEARQDLQAIIAKDPIYQRGLNYEVFAKELSKYGEDVQHVGDLKAQIKESPAMKNLDFHKR